MLNIVRIIEIKKNINEDLILANIKSDSRRNQVINPMYQANHVEKSQHVTSNLKLQLNKTYFVIGKYFHVQIPFYL